MSHHTIRLFDDDEKVRRPARVGSLVPCVSCLACANQCGCRPDALVCSCAVLPRRLCARAPPPCVCVRRCVWLCVGACVALCIAHRVTPRPQGKISFRNLKRVAKELGEVRAWGRVM